MTNTLAPMIYVACLAAYNSGMLHGRWIDATQHVDTISEDIQAILADSPITDAEEWAIHDYQDFAGLELAEYTGTAKVNRLATCLQEYGEWASGASGVYVFRHI